MGDQDYKQAMEAVGHLDPVRRMYGYTREQFLDPKRLLEKAEREWNEYFEKEDAFDLVKNAVHWKGRIDAIVPREKAKICQEAIGFFAYGCSKVWATDDPKMVRITAPGYWEYEAGKRK